MLDKTQRPKKILKELDKYNKYARIYLRKNSLGFKAAYNNFQKSEAWTSAKALLIEYFALENNIFICPICNNILDPYHSTLHHIYYDKKKLFEPKYIEFVHHDCHDRYHQENGTPGTKKHIRLYFNSRGLRIYFSKGGKVHIRYEFGVLLVLLLIFALFFMT